MYREVPEPETEYGVDEPQLLTVSMRCGVTLAMSRIEGIETRSVNSVRRLHLPLCRSLQYVQLR